MENRICLNCGLCVNRIKRHVVVQLDSRVISLISNWITPIIITDDDYICESCYHLAMKTVNRNLAGGEEGTSSSRQMGHTQVCLLCGRSILRRPSDLIIKNNTRRLDQAIHNLVAHQVAHEITSTGRLCHPCWLKLRRTVLSLHMVDQGEQYLENSSEVQDVLPNVPSAPSSPVQSIPASNPSAPGSPINEENEPELQPISACITLENYRRAPNTSAHCVFPECVNTHLHRISDALRATILKNYNFYMPVHVRICSEHLQQNNHWELLYEAPSSVSTFTSEHVEHVFSLVNVYTSNVDFDNVLNMDDHLFQYWFGITKIQFQLILNDIPNIAQLHRGIGGLAAYLLKLRNGDSNERIASLFNIPRRTLEDLMKKVRLVLIQDFVPLNLGIQHLPREELKSHNLIVPNGIFNNSIVICDGTYIYLHKSSNYMFQKDSYSVHKYRNLLKPFLMVTCDGYILDCFGPYKATTSDSDIMISLFRDENSPLRTYFRENDIFVLDRGFRDSIGLLEECQYKPWLRIAIPKLYKPKDIIAMDERPKV